MSDKHPETVAKHVLEAAILGARMVYREDQSDMEYDFDLYYPNGEISAVEVTSSRDRSVIQMKKRISNPKKGGSRIAAVRCKQTWCIFASSDADINVIRKYADQRLAELENEGVHKFAFFDQWKVHRSDAATKICNELRLFSGSIIPSESAPEIILSSVPRAGAVGASTATTAGEKEIEPNREKLGRAHTKERHLVVYVDQSNGGSWLAMESFSPPNTKPTLPFEITHLWLIAQTGGNRYVVWRGTSTEKWHKVALPETTETSQEG